jgi:hypothetical protein
MTAARDFEALIAKIQRDIEPNATVEQNKRIRGASGRLREIDVAITKPVGLSDVLIAIECKRYRRPVGIDKLEAFVTKLNDVGANQGIMLSQSGFDEGARAVARVNGILLFTHHEAARADWYKATGSELWVEFIKTESVEVSAHAIFKDGSEQVITAGTSLCGENGERATIDEMVKPLLEDARDRRPVGAFRGWLDPVQPLYLDPDRTRNVQRIRVDGENKSWGVRVDPVLASGHILRNEVGEDRYRRLETEAFDWRALIESPARRELSEAELKPSDDPAIERWFAFDPQQTKPYIRLAIRTFGRTQPSQDPREKPRPVSRAVQKPSARKRRS